MSNGQPNVNGKAVKASEELQGLREKLKDPIKYLHELIEKNSGRVPRVPQVYGYVRVSKDIQVEQGLSVPAQKEMVEGYYSWALKPKGYQFRGIEYDDFGVSATKKRFVERPAGQRLMGLLARGDHLIVTKVDRIVRNAREFAILLDDFMKRGVTLDIIELGGDANSPTNQMLAHVMSVMANIESNNRSERNRARNVYARRHCMAVTNYPPLGARRVKKRIEGGRIAKMDEWWPEMRAFMSMVVDLKDNQGMTLKEISEVYKDRFFALQSMNARDKRWKIPSMRHMHKMAIRSYAMEKFYRDHGITKISSIPSPGATDLAVAYARKKGWITSGEATFVG